MGLAVNDAFRPGPDMRGKVHVNAFLAQLLGNLLPLVLQRAPNQKVVVDFAVAVRLFGACRIQNLDVALRVSPYNQTTEFFV